MAPMSDDLSALLIWLAISLRDCGLIARLSGFSDIVQPNKKGRLESRPF
jgi:hypothetical protein